MNRMLIVAVLIAGVLAGWLVRPLPLSAGTPDWEERSARALERIADEMRELKRADRSIECKCACPR